MINLIPANTTDLDYLWELVSERNKWFIKLRYSAVVMLASLYVFIVFFSGEKLSDIQYKGIIGIFAITLLYNITLSYIFNSGKIRNDIRKFNPIKFAFLQIVFDLISLMVLVYLTGLLNSPFYLFFIFHAIIGSMILPGRLVYIIVCAVLTIFSFLTLSVHFGLIEGFLISNTGSIVTLKTTYVFLNLISFWLMMLVSVMFSNNLASALYKRDQQLIEAIYELELSEKEKQRYVLAVVHELKSPVSAIVSYLNLLIGGIAGEINGKAKDILLKMKRRSEESITLTNNIIEVSRVKLLEVIKKEEVDPEIIISDLIEKMKDKFEGANILFTYDDDRKTGKSIYADESLIRILLSNIISNSLKYTPSGGSVNMKLFDSGKKDKLCISLSDTGIGIPEKDIDRISDEFYRASNVKKSRVEGIGLGLSVVKKIVERHDGTMKIISPNNKSSKDNPGTTIYIEIPYVG